MFDFSTDAAPRRLGLTPMIDVVFLLLVFFMLTAQFTRDLSLPLQRGQAGAGYEGAPRLLRVGPDALWLNGRQVAQDTLVAAIVEIAPDREAIIVLRCAQDTPLQRLVDVMQVLGRAGYARLVLVE